MRNWGGHLRLLAFAGCLAALALPAAAGAGSGTVYWRGQSDDGSKLRLAIHNGKVTHSAYHGEVRCMYDGKEVDPYFGTDVISLFDKAEVRPNGTFISHQRYRNRNGLTGQNQPFERTLMGLARPRKVIAEVNIHYRTPLTRRGHRLATCWTGHDRFALHRVDPR